jgi:putative transcriptional regulator
MSNELEQFKQDLLKSVKQMRQGEAARCFGADIAGLGQGRREPTGAAKTLLRVAYEHPEVLLKLERL